MKYFITLFTNVMLFIVTAAQPGTLDKTFGDSGTVVTPGIYDACSYMALQKDGKIILAGSGFKDLLGFQLVRYNSDGSIDQSFGVEGRVFTPFTNES